MKKKITESTAFVPLGNPVQAKLFRVASGEFAGRRAALIAIAPDTIALFRSDTPGSAWPAPLTVAADVNDRSFDAVMMPNGDIHLVYGESSTCYLVTRKLTYSDGAWTVGEKVTIYNGAQCYDPSLAVDPSGRLWVAWARYVTPSRSIYIKTSSDDGATWGEGPEDVGEQLQSGAMFAGVKVLTDFDRVHAVFYNQDIYISVRSRLLSGGEWTARQTIVAGSGFTKNFDAAVAANGHLGLVYDLGVLYYCEYDRTGWSAPEAISGSAAVSPQLRFIDGVPVVTFLERIGTTALLARYTDRRRGVFSEPAPFDRASGQFDSVFLYDASSATFHDRTSEAAEATAGDLFHPESGKLLEAVGDAIYLGMDVKFRLANFRLSTPGAGGTLRFAYWNGLAWQTFIPADGLTDLSATDVALTFWGDYDSLPANWQKSAVNGRSRFWIRLDVQSPFTTGPLGDQVTSATEITGVSLRR